MNAFEWIVYAGVGCYVIYSAVTLTWAFRNRDKWSTDITADEARGLGYDPKDRPMLIGDFVGGTIDTGFTRREWELGGYADNEKFILECAREIYFIQEQRATQAARTPNTHLSSARGIRIESQ